MPSYKLIYFDITGLGELIRYLFAYGNIEFDDTRITFEEWPAIKPSFTWGHLPVLEIDGKEYIQSLAIARYLSHIVGIAGKDLMEELKINMSVDTINDWRLDTTKPIYEMDSEIRKMNIEKLLAEYLPNMLSKFDNLVKSNGGYFAIGRVGLYNI